ncbi:MAG: tRNA (5-methylaminomethyl-2-thiouridine)(34)-methyltransferase MnmD [Albidovulum sp.]|nr:tRNA (5-methylaminomethyl-2-thiouridine)(34)-methyltransferase MnmD [Albidovulum sp.]
MGGDAEFGERVEWLADGTPFSPRFAESYFTQGDGLEESRHVFIRGNMLPERFNEKFSIAELGFGTGLNMLAALECWRIAERRGALSYTGFERYPLSAEAIARSLRAFPSIVDLAAPFLDAWSSGATRFTTSGFEAEFVIGDARESLMLWNGRADAWFLDGFSPGRNPQLWEPRLLQRMAERTRPGGTFATFTAAGRVRRDLAAAGFEVSRRQGYGRKRHMLAGRLSSQ